MIRLQPKKGTLAFCSKGCLGLITQDNPIEVIYGGACAGCANAQLGDLTINCTCVRGLAYVGIHLTDKIAPIGSPWSSRIPHVVGEIRRVVTTTDGAEDLVCVEGRGEIEMFNPVIPKGLLAGFGR